MSTQTSCFRLSFAFMLIILVQRARTKNTDIIWASPLDGDVFGPGDTIIGKWNATKAVVSPSFRLCMSSNTSEPGSGPEKNGTSDGDSGCGSTVWPTVEQSAGSFFISLAVPDVPAEEEFYLRMEDDFGEIIQSPMFSLSPNAASVVNAEPTPPATIPVNSPPPPPPADLTSSLPGAPVASDAIVPSTPPTSPVNPYLLAARTPPPTAAFAVPLSVVAAILLAAAVLSLRHHRKLADERARDAEKLALSRQSSLSSFKSSSTRHDDVEHALNVLSRNNVEYEAAPMPIPLFMPVDIRREHRQSTRQPFPTYTTSACPPTENMMYASPPRTYFPPLPTPTRNLEDEDATNAAVTHSVISDYMHPSPIPPSCLLSAPHKVHVRSEAVAPPSSSALGTFTYQDKPLPRSPQPGPMSAEKDRNIYDAVSSNLMQYRQA